MRARSGIRISVSNRRTRYVAVDRDDGFRVIAEGATAADASAKARVAGKRFSLMYVPPKGQTCIY